jgi:hypothetical protein
MEELLKLGMVALVAGVGAYFGSYLKKKGENLATHEDIDRVVDSVRAVTTATKEIEAKISNDVWDRQKRWEVKRDVLFETTKKIAIAKNALASLYAHYKTEKESKEKGQPERLEERIRVGREWNDAADGLEEATMLADLACGEEMKKVLAALTLFTRSLIIEITKGHPEAFQESVKEHVAKLDAISVAMRKEIGAQKSV